jgi:hypothetical protein
MKKRRQQQLVERSEHVGRARAAHVAAFRLGWLFFLSVACGSRSVQLRQRPPELLDFIVVPTPPPVVPVEIMPPQPRKDAVWLDGQWAWGGDRWQWKRGGWVSPPEGATLSMWLYSYQTNGLVRFWPGTWIDAKGQPMEDPPILAGAQGRFEPR